ncbi:MAG: V-type ATP synthase subunit E [Thermoplasmatales archaeon]|nr:MAG: V-type ATP synthase subunit E [Thermoplasmatales archaeon]
MTAEKIIEQIKKDTDLEIKKIKKDAEDQAKIIISNAKKEAEEDVKKILYDGKIKSENIKKIHISKANQDIKREIMNAREQIIDLCFSKAHHELSILKGKNYEKIVENLIKDGMKKLGGKCSIITSRAADKTIAGKLGLSVIGRIEKTGGVIIKSADGKVTLDYTFDGILEREKGKIRRKVGKILFT